MHCHILVLCWVIMASIATDGGQEVLLSCKKCGTDHKKPIGNKCEKLKLDKLERDEKRDLSKDIKTCLHVIIYREVNGNGGMYLISHQSTRGW